MVVEAEESQRELWNMGEKNSNSEERNRLREERAVNENDYSLYVKQERPFISLVMFCSLLLMTNMCSVKRTPSDIPCLKIEIKMIHIRFFCIDM